MYMSAHDVVLWTFFFGFAIGVCVAGLFFVAMR